MSKRREKPPLSDRGRGWALRAWAFYLLALMAWEIGRASCRERV